MKSLLDEINGCLDGQNYDRLRNYVFSRYEAEDEIIVERKADELLSVLAPYVETEEAIPDSNRETRLRRLAKLLSTANEFSTATLSVFGIAYDEITKLTNKFDEGIIPKEVYVDQLRKLTPAVIEVDLIIQWAQKHKGEKEPDLAKLT